MQGVTTLLFRLFEILVTPSNMVQCCSILGGQFESVWTLLNWTLTFPFVTWVPFYSFILEPFEAQPAKEVVH